MKNETLLWSRSVSTLGPTSTGLNPWFRLFCPVRIEDAAAMLNATPELGPHIWLGNPWRFGGPGLPLKAKEGEPPAGGATARTATGLIAATIESLARTLPESTSERVVVVDGTPVEDALAGRLASIAEQHRGMTIKS